MKIYFHVFMTLYLFSLLISQATENIYAYNEKATIGDSINLPLTINKPGNLITAKLPAPVPLFPANNAVNVTLFPDIKWSKVTGAYTYKLMLGQAPDCIGWALLNSDTINSFDNGFQVNTDYYWKVRVENYNGYYITDTSDWTPVFKFSTLDAPLNPPVIYSPQVTYDVPVDQVFKWYKIVGADSYNIQLATDTSFKFIYKDTITTALNYSIKLQFKTMYYFRVNAINSKGKSPWTKTQWLYTSRQFLSGPTLVSPVDQDIAVPITGQLLWKSYYGGDNFNIQLSLSNDFSSPVIDSIIQPLTINYQQLTYGKYYYWRVKAFSSADTSDWSPVWSFRTEYDKLPGLPEEVKLITPKNNALYTIYYLSGDISVNGDNFTWMPGPTQVDWYWFEISADSNFITSSIDSNTTNTMTHNSTIFRINKNKGVGFWRVKAGNESGWGHFSEVRRFLINVVGVEEPIAKQDNFIAPNPANDFIDLFINPDTGFVNMTKFIIIYNTLGEPVISIPWAPDSSFYGQNGNNKTIKIDISALQPGIYFVRVGQKVLKIVKI